MYQEDLNLEFWEALAEWQRGQAEADELQQPDYDEMEAEYQSALPSGEDLAPTRIIAVININGTRAMAEVWGRPNAQLFEIAEGPHSGKRGPDTELFDLAGPIIWDKEWVSDYQTGVQILAVGLE